MNIEVLKLALLRLEQLNETSIGGPCLPAEIDGAMDALRASLDTSQSHSCTWPACKSEMVEQEPVAWQAVGGSIWGHKTCEDDRPLYTTPARPWVGLTKEEAADCWSNEAVRTWHAIEAPLKEKNAT